MIDAWDDPRAHGAFLQYCQGAGALSDAAARYRGMKGDHERGAEAERRLSGVVLLALQSLEVERTVPRQGLPRWVTAAIALVCGFFIIYTLFRAVGP